MNPIDGLIYGFQVALTPHNLLFALLGVLIGTAVGILPGMSPTMVIALLLVPTIHLPPETGLIMLAGIYYGTQYGDSMTAILMGVPSEAFSVVIALDGFEMAKKGKAGVALAVAAVGAWIGATVGLIGLVALAGTFGRAALAFGPPEFFVLSFVGMIILARMSGGGVWKGLLALSLGLAVTTVGMDPLSGFVRFGFGITELMSGFKLLPIVMGAIGLAGILQLTATSKTLPTPASFKFRDLFPSPGEWRESIPAALRGAVIGFFFGLLPGPGAVLSTFVSYRLERRLYPGEVGSGSPRAVAGPKAADDAALSGHLVPLMVLGIPFSAVTAILFAGLLLHGIQPGPLLMTQNPEIFWGLVAAMYIGNLALLILNFPLVGMWTSVLKIPQPILSAGLVILMLVGSYSVDSSVMDMITLLAAGVIGYALRTLGLDLTITILGLVLGPLLEKSFRQSLFASRGSPAIFFGSWIDVVLWLLLVAFFVTPLIQRFIARRGGGAEAFGVDGAGDAVWGGAGEAKAD